MKTQVCKKCLIEKPIEKFQKDKGRPNPRSTCKDCRYKQRDHESEKLRHRVYMKERRKTDPESVRRNWERSVYGASKEDIGVKNCMVCGENVRLCIDHDHITGKIRGILCGKCNIAIGLMRDNPVFLESAAAYLKDGPHFELDRKVYP